MTFSFETKIAVTFFCKPKISSNEHPCPKLCRVPPPPPLGISDYSKKNLLTRNSFLNISLFCFLGSFSTRWNFSCGMIFSFVFQHPLSASWSLNKRKCRSAWTILPSGKQPLYKDAICRNSLKCFLI